MKKRRLYIGDIIMSQISMYISSYKNKRTERIISNNSIELSNILFNDKEINSLKLNFDNFREIWISLGYQDYLIFDDLNNSINIIEEEIKYLLNKNKNILFIIPFIKEHKEEYSFNQSNLSISQFMESIEFIISNNNINCIDLKDILDYNDVSFNYGINDIGLNKILDYLLGNDFI